MIQGVVAAILDRYLNDYISNFDSKTLSINLLKGEVVLTNLLVKPFALDHVYADVPFVIHRGELEELKLRIPWHNLKNKSVVCEVSGLRLTLRPKKEYQWDQKKEREKTESLKKSALQKFEMQKKLVEQYKKKQADDELLKKQEKEKSMSPSKKKGDMKSGKKKKDDKKSGKKKGKKRARIPIFETLVETILNNIVIKVNKVFVRYEHSINKERSFSMTMNVGDVKVVSTNENWKEGFSKKVGDITYKLVQLKQFSVDMKVNDGPNRYLFKPTKGELKLRMQSLSANMDLSKPIFQGEVGVESIDLSVSDLQYKCFMSLIDYVGSFTKFERYRKFRPQLTQKKTPIASINQGKEKVVKKEEEVPIVGSERAKKWWKFAYNCIIDRKRSLTKQFRIAAMVGARGKYIELYKKFLGVRWYKKITKQEKKEMEEFEETINSKTIIMYRGFARFEIEKQNTLYDLLEQKNQKIKKGLKTAKKEKDKSNFARFFEGFGKKKSKKKKRLEKIEAQKRKETMELLKLQRIKKIGPEHLVFTPQYKLMIYREGMQSANEFDLSIDKLKKIGDEKKKGVKKPPTIVQLQMKVKLDDLKLSLKTDKELKGRKNLDSIAEAQFREFFALINLEKDGFNINMNMNKFEILDHDKDTQFKSILFHSNKLNIAPSLPSRPKGKTAEVENKIESQEKSEEGEKVVEEKAEKVVVSKVIAKIPVPSSTKDLLNIKIIKKKNLVKFLMFLDQMSFVLNLELVKKIVSFFVVDEIPNVENFELVSQLKTQQKDKKKKDAAKKRRIAKKKKGLLPEHDEDSDYSDDEDGGEQVEEEGEQETQKKDLKEVTLLEMDIAVDAPLIYVPLVCTDKNTEYLLLDLGNLKFIKEKEKGNFNLTMSDMHVVFPKKTRIFSPVKVTEENRMIENLNLELVIEHLTNQILGKNKDGTHRIGQKLNLSMMEKKDIDMFLSPSKGQFLLRLINNFTSFAANPFVGETLTSGVFEVKGPISDGEWKQYFVELNSSLKMLNFCVEKTSKDSTAKKKIVSGFLKLGNGVVLTPKKEDLTKEITDDNFNGFVLIFEKTNGRNMEFKFRTSDPNIKKVFVDRIMEIDHRNFTSRRKKLLRETEKEQEKIEKLQLLKEDEDLGITEEKNPMLICLDGLFDQISVHFTNDKLAELVDIVFENIAMNYCSEKKNKGDNDFSITLPKAQVLTRKDKIGTLTLLEFGLLLPDPEAKDKAILVDLKFDEVKINLYQKLIKIFIHFFYDMIEVYDELEMAKQSFSQDKDLEEQPDMKTIVNISLGNIGVALFKEKLKPIKENVKLISFKMNKSFVGVTVARDGVKVKSSFNDALIENNIVKGLYPVVVSPLEKDKKSLVKFELEVDPLAKALEINSKVIMEVLNIQYTHIHRLVTHLLNFSLDIIGVVIKRERKRTIAIKEEEPPMYFFGIKLSLKNLSVFLPISELDKRGIKATCGNLTIANAIKDKLIQEFTIQSDSIDLMEVREDSSFVQLTSTEKNSKIGFSIVAAVVSRELDRELKHPTVVLDILVPELEVKLSPLQVQLICHCMLKNLLKGVSSFELTSELQLTKYLNELGKLLQRRESTVVVPPKFVDITLNVEAKNLKIVMIDTKKENVLLIDMPQFLFKGKILKNEELDFVFSTGAMKALDIQKVENKFRTILHSSVNVKLNMDEKKSLHVFADLIKPQCLITSHVVFELFRYFMECKFEVLLKDIESLEREKHQIEELEASKRNFLAEEKKPKQPVSLFLKFNGQDWKVAVVEDFQDEKSRLIELRITDIAVCLTIEDKDLKGKFEIAKLEGGTNYLKDNFFKSIIYPMKGSIGMTCDLGSKNTEKTKKISCEVNGDLISQLKTVSVSYNDVMMIVAVATKYADEFEKNYKQYLPKKEFIEEQLKEVQVVGKKGYEKSKEFIKKTKEQIPTDLRVNILVSLKSSNLFLELVDDSEGYKTPLYNVHLVDLENKVTFDVFEKDQMNFSCTSKFNVYLDYYNNYRNSLEPVIEKSQTPFRFVMKYDTMTHAKIELNFIDSLNLNITHDMIEHTVETANNWITKKDKTRKNYFSLPPFAIANFTGYNICWWKKKVETESDKRVLKKREIQQFEIKGYLKGQKFITLMFNNDKMTTISVCITRVKHIEIPVTLNNEKKILNVSILLENGQKRVYLHIGKLIRNNSNISYRFKFFSSDKSIQECVLKKNDYYYLSEMQYTGRFQFRPTFEKGEKSKDSDYSYNMGGKLGVKELFSIERGKVSKQRFTRNSKESEGIYYCTFMHVYKSKFADQIVIKNPASFVNLLAADIEIEISHVIDRDVRSIEKFSVKEGEEKFLYSLNLNKDCYMYATIKNWTPARKYKIWNVDKKEKYEKRLELLDNKSKTLKIRLFRDCTDQTINEYQIYAQYWILNQSGIRDLSIYSGNLAVYELAGQRFQEKPRIYLNEEPRLVLKKPSVKKETKKFSIQTVKRGQEIVLDGKHLGVYVEVGPGKYRRTKIAKITPRFMLSNKMPDKIFVRQISKYVIHELEKDEVKPFFWEDIKSEDKRFIEFHLPNTAWTTTNFNISAISQILVLLRQKNEKTTKVKEIPVMVTIQQVKGCIYVEFAPAESPPFIIQNDTNHGIILQQDKSPGYAIVKKKSKIGYCLTNHYGSMLLNIKLGEKRGCINLNQLNATRIMILGEEKIFITVTAQKMSKLVIISDQPFKKKYKNDVTPKDCVLQMDVFVKEIGVSLCTSQEQKGVVESSEILYGTLSGITFALKVNEQNLFVDFYVNDMQVDNQTRQALFPIALYNKKIEGKEFVKFALVFNFKETSFIYIPYLSFLMQEAIGKFELKLIEEIAKFVEELIAFVQTFNNDEEKKEEILNSMTGKIQTRSDKIHLDKYFFFEMFELHPIKFVVTFNMKSSDDQEALTNKYKALSLLSNLGNGLNTNVEDVELKLNSLILQYPFMSIQGLIKGISEHYAKHFFKQLYKIVGGLDLIGNPVGLFSNVGEGFHDLFYEPTHGITSVKDFVEGVGKGAGGLVSKSVYGVGNTFQKLVNTGSDVLLLLSLDGDYIEEKKENRQKKKAKNIAEGFGYGIMDGLKGVGDGLAGVFVKPVQGAKKQGFGGFLKGVVKGVAGLPMKPIAGAVDFFGRVGEGVKNQAKSEKSIYKKRCPRIFGKDGTLNQYDKKAAKAQDILRKVESEKFFAENYVTHSKIDKDKLFILTEDNVFFFQIKTSNRQVVFNVDWHHKFSEFDPVKSTPLKDGVRLYFKKKVSTGLIFKKSIHSRDIRTADPHEVNFLVLAMKKICEDDSKKVDFE